MDGLMKWKKCPSVMITGAGRGLGLQIVETLVSGCFSPGKIIATTRQPDQAQKLQKLAARHLNIHITALDVVNQESLEKAREEVGQLVHEEGLACLINNAGIDVDGTFETVTAEAMIKNFHTNTVAPLMITKGFLPLLKQAAFRGGAALAGGMSIQRAAVINMSSQMGSVQLTWNEGVGLKHYPYRASKSALNMLSRCMAIDMQPDGILCVSIHPGQVRTDMGGAEAPLDPKESISSVLSVVGGLTEKDHGSFLNYKGEVLPW